LLGHVVTLEIEPGRYLVAERSVLVAEVRATKQITDGALTITLMPCGTIGSCCG